MLILTEESFHMAEVEGFEPSHAIKHLQAFQACPFSRLGKPPLNRLIINNGLIFKQNNECINVSIFISIL